MAGLRQICSAYSRIALGEICEQLGLAESIEGEAAIVQQLQSKLVHLSKSGPHSPSSSLPSASQSNSSSSSHAKKPSISPGLINDTAALVSKAIQDGVINAKIDFAAQTVTTKTLNEVYSTTQPQEAFHLRINYCNNLYNETVEALQYRDQNSKISKFDEEEEDPEQVVSEILAELDMD